MADKPLSLSMKVVILDDQGRCLLIRRSMQSKGNPGKWDFPGGKVDAGEAFDQGLLREVAEETGLQIRLGRVLGAGESEAPAKRVVYLFLEARLLTGKVRLSEEHSDFMWVAVHNLPKQDIAPQFLRFASGYAEASIAAHVTSRRANR